MSDPVLYCQCTQPHWQMEGASVVAAHFVQSVVRILAVALADANTGPTDLSEADETRYVDHAP